MKDVLCPTSKKKKIKNFGHILIGGQIHDVHLSFIRQYKDITSPLDIILACGMNNVPTDDTSDEIVFQFESFLRSISEHSEIHGHENPNKQGFL